MPRSSAHWLSRAAVCCLLVAGCGLAGADPAGDATWPATPPGASAVSDALARRLRVAYEALGPSYVPRTEHRLGDGKAVYVNRLMLEASPYLIQHAHNPVDWFPWGPEAFAKARREDKPIFLSIGYSTCHWCHVMERESFDDEEVARLLNEAFVCIKVDREQRPDVDEVYMTAVQLLTGSGGWPLSSFLTSDGQPFFGGTYFPRETFLDLLRQVADAWQGRRPELVAQAGKLAAAVAQVTSAAGEASEVGETQVAAAVDELLARHDGRLGGFSPAPKFPQEPELLFLLEHVLRSGDARAFAAVETTLERMARGGIYDQIGGGFHRYSTDAAWQIPHFEKMLYNQAQLARVYFEAARLGGGGSGGVLFERVARQTLDFVLRDMTSREGAFTSATDADSEGREGAFFVWTPDQVRAALPAADADLAIRAFGVSEAGNFEGANVLHLDEPLPEVAAEMTIGLDELLARLDRIRQRLYAAREARIHPLRDDKVVTAWNAMTITTLARAGKGLGEARYLGAARRAADFLWQRHRRDDGRLWRASLDGNASVEAGLDDYADLLEALIALYDATAEPGWLDKAESLAGVLIERFWDDAGGGFFMSEDDHGGRLLVRPKSPSDDATPSGNAVAVRALAELAARTGDPEYRRKAETTLAAFSSRIRRRPSAFSTLLRGADELLHGAAGPVDYGAGGVARAEAALAEGELTVVLGLAPGWHVNSDRPLDEALVPTRLTASSGAALGPVQYPEAQLVELGFRAQPVSVFQGRVTFRSRVVAHDPAPPSAARLRLRIQACDARKCFEPEDMILEISFLVRGDMP